MAIDFRQYTIRQLPRYKAFASKLEKTFSSPKKNHQENEISIPRQVAPIHSVLCRGADHRSDRPDPRPRTRL